MLKKNIHHTFPGVIWRICPDDTGRYLVAEIRLPEQKESFFTGIDLDTGISSFEGIQPGEKWFNGIEAAGHGCLFLHGYLSETLPEHRGIFAYDLENGRNLWNHYNLVFNQLHREGIIAGDYKTEPRRYYLYHARTGGRGPAVDRHAASFYQPAASPLFPEKISLDHPASQLPGRSAGFIDEAEYLKVQDHELFSVYEKGKNGLLNRLLVYPPAGRDGSGPGAGSVFTDIMATAIRTPVWGTFFVLNGQLIYVRKKSELLSYTITGS